MKFVKLLHNPAAGDGSHEAEELVEMIEKAGFKCTHESTKELGSDLKTHTIDIVALAGGDGTIRKIAKRLLEDNVPIGLFPKGTANNIAKTLGLADDPRRIVKAWMKNKVKAFDIGKVIGLEEETFFLEGLGYGVFPLLMDGMKGEDKKKIDDPEVKIRTALELLHDIVAIAGPVQCDIKVDGQDRSGRYLLVEVMNTRSIGPNLNLSPMADPGDGQFEVVMITEDHRQEFLDYLESKVEGEEELKFFKVLRGSKIEICWHGNGLHIDDERILLKKPVTLTIELQPKAFKFLVE